MTRQDDDTAPDDTPLLHAFNHCRAYIQAARTGNGPGQVEAIKKLKAVIATSPGLDFRVDSERISVADLTEPDFVEALDGLVRHGIRPPADPALVLAMYASVAEQTRNRWADRCYESASLLPPDFDWAPRRATNRVFDLATVAANLCHALNEIDPGDGSLTADRVEAILRARRVRGVAGLAAACAKVAGACGVKKGGNHRDAARVFNPPVKNAKARRRGTDWIGT